MLTYDEERNSQPLARGVKGYLLESGLTVQMEHRKPELTEREIQVLQLIVRGQQNKQIAHILNIAEETAKIHVKHIFNKLGVQNRTHAATAAIQLGIIQL